MRTRHAEIRPQMLPTSNAADRQRRAGRLSWPQARPAADSIRAQNQRAAERYDDNLDPTCPGYSNAAGNHTVCGELNRPDATHCASCGAQLYPSQSSEAIAATARSTAIASPTSKG